MLQSAKRPQGAGLLANGDTVRTRALRSARLRTYARTQILDGDMVVQPIEGTRYCYDHETDCKGKYMYTVKGADYSASAPPPPPALPTEEEAEKMVAAAIRSESKPDDDETGSDDSSADAAKSALILDTSPAVELQPLPVEESASTSLEPDQVDADAPDPQDDLAIVPLTEEQINADVGIKPEDATEDSEPVESDEGHVDADAPEPKEDVALVPVPQAEEDCDSIMDMAAWFDCEDRKRESLGY